MDMEELIEISKTRPATKEEVEAFAERVKKREEQFKKEQGKITNEFLNREYTI